MAHECPDCGTICHCGSDIDDLLLNRERNIIRCLHYRECEKEDNDDPIDDPDNE